MTPGEIERRARRVLLVVGLVFLALVSSAAADELSSTPRLALAWHDGYGFCGVVQDEVQAAVEKLFGRAGVGVAWKSEPQGGLEQPRELFTRVILLNLEPTRLGLKPTTLGAVLDRAEPETAYVFVPVVMRLLGHRPEPSSACASPRVMVQISRALAYVVSHEILHVVAPSHPHAEEGWMDAALGPEELLEPRVDLDRACARAFTESLRSRVSNR